MAVVDAPQPAVEEESIDEVDTDDDEMDKTMQKVRQIQIANERAKARQHVVMSEKWEAGWEAWDSDDDEEIEKARKAAKEEMDRREAEEDADWEAWDSDEEQRQAGRKQHRKDLETKRLMERIRPDFLEFKRELIAKKMKEMEVKEAGSGIATEKAILVGKQ